MFRLPQRAGAIALTLCLVLAANLSACAAQSQSVNNGVNTSAVYAMDIGEFLAAKGYHPIRLRRAASGLDFVSLKLNGTRGLFLLDTGASNSVLHNALLTRYGISANSGIASETAIGAGGEVRLSAHVISGLELGGHTFALPQISATDLSVIISALSREQGVRIDGIIGQDLLILHGGVVDVAGERLFLRKR